MRDALIILCPPRSYSSVLSGIIGCHPECYGLPELHLFAGRTLGEVRNHEVRRIRRHGRHGLLRTIAQLHEGVQTEESVARADEWIEQHLDWPIHRVFDHIQELVGPKLLVEKSPTALLKCEYIERILQVFPNASLLHLTRHPRSMVESVRSMRENHGSPIAKQAGSPSRFNAEEEWRTAHENVITATQQLPLGQCIRLKGEEVMANLAIYLPQICDWLGIRSDAEAIEAMMHPENSPYACPGPRGAPRGNDPNFLENPRLDPERLARIREPLLEGELSWREGAFEKNVVRLAKQLGYS
jgi:Sulfotransferase family